MSIVIMGLKVERQKKFSLAGLPGAGVVERGGGPHQAKIQLPMVCVEALWHEVA